MQNDDQNPFTMDELQAMLTPEEDTPAGAICELIAPFYICTGPQLAEKDLYQLALLTFGFLASAGVDLCEFKRVAEDPVTWTDCCAYKSALQGGDDDVIGVYYTKIFIMHKDSTNKELMKLQTIRLVAMSLKLCKIEVKDYIGLVARIMVSDDAE